MILIVDAMNLFIRSFVANPAMSSHGYHIGGAVGFVSSIKMLCQKFKPTKIIIIWESGGSSRRRAIYSEYKNKRKPQKLNRFYDDDIPNTVENRNYQITFLTSFLKTTPICQLYIPDCEADDVIGYISKYSFSTDRKVIVSSDKDFYQLLDSKTIIYSPTLKSLVTSKDVIEKFGISTLNFCLAKCICGDPSDNIKGVRGAGFKSLAKRFPVLSESRDVSIQEIIEISSKQARIKRAPKLFKNISENEALIRRNWKLSYLDTTSLSASQIDQIIYNINTFKGKRDKIGAMRMLIKEGIQNFNIDGLFFALSRIQN